MDNSVNFTCQKGIGVTFGVLSTQMKVSSKGKKFLNSNSKCVLKTPGQCTLQPNPSGAGFMPCNQSSVPVTAWHGVDNIICIDGAKALTGKSSTMCPLGGKICLQGSCNSVFTTGCSLTINEIIVKNTKTEKCVSGKNGKVYISDKNVQFNNKSVGSVKINSEVKEKAFIKEDDKKHQKVLSETVSKYAKCPYENCDERNKCSYFVANPGVNNDSAELKRKFELDRPDEAAEYKKLHLNARKEFSEYGWGYEGHHMISGNQVFMAVDKSTGDLKYGHLLKLANMCNYDINNAYNCILLPSMARRDGPWGTLELFEKEAKAFDVMDIMKRQWHLGGHAYTIPKDSLKYYRPSDEQVLMSGSGEYFPNYAVSVQSKLNKINDIYSRKRCWRKLDTPEFREKFVRMMNDISNEIENALKKFSVHPKDSYPYFVSKMAVDYAYDAPKTGKIIFVYYKNGSVYASKFRVSRKRSNDYRIVVTQNDEVPYLKISDDTLLEFVRYSENIIHFWIDSRIERGLPWNIDDEYIIRKDIDGNDIYKYACNHATELFTFIDKNGMPNNGQIARIRKRWKEVRENVSVRG